MQTRERQTDRQRARQRQRQRARGRQRQRARETETDRDRERERDRDRDRERERDRDREREADRDRERERQRQRELSLKSLSESAPVSDPARVWPIHVGEGVSVRACARRLSFRPDLLQRDEEAILRSSHAADVCRSSRRRTTTTAAAACGFRAHLKQPGFLPLLLGSECRWTGLWLTAAVGRPSSTTLPKPSVYLLHECFYLPTLDR